MVPYAAEVVLICHMGSLKLAAEYFSEKFHRKMSIKPVRDVLEKVRAGIIPVTEAEIQEAANLHPLARRFLAKAPWAANPKMADKVESTPAPKRKPGRPKKSDPAAAVETVNPEEPNQTGKGKTSTPATATPSSPPRAFNKQAPDGNKSPIAPEEVERRRKLTEDWMDDDD